MEEFEYDQLTVEQVREFSQERLEDLDDDQKLDEGIALIQAKVGNVAQAYIKLEELKQADDVEGDIFEEQREMAEDQLADMLSETFVALFTFAEEVDVDIEDALSESMTLYDMLQSDEVDDDDIMEYMFGEEYVEEMQDRTVDQLAAAEDRTFH